MASLEELHFEVVLDHAKFDAEIKKVQTMATNLNNSLSNVLKVKNLGSKQVISDKGVANARDMANYLEQIRQKIQSMPKGNFLVGDADKLNATLNETNKKLDQILAKSKKVGTEGSAAVNSLRSAWLRITATFWSVIGVARILVRVFGSAVKKISEFEQANANMATILQVSRDEVKALTNDALTLGRTTEWTASQVTELQTNLAKLGYSIPQIQNMQASVLQFATAVGAKLPDAANLAGAALRMFGMHSSETQRALEILTASTNKTALDFQKLKVSLPYVGAIAHSIGMDVAQTASLLGVLTNAGLESSRAGTGLRQVLLELSKADGKLQTAMGGNIKTFDDFVNGLQAMRDRGLEAGEATKLVSTRASSALLILANSVDDIRRLNKEVRETDGLLKDIQQERLATLHGSTLLLKSAWEGLIQTFRDSAGPMSEIVRGLTKIINATSLAASRANRIAQGTKQYTGSDELTKYYTEKYESLLKKGYSQSEAQRIVNEELADIRDQAVGANEREVDKMKRKRWWRIPLESTFMAASTALTGGAAGPAAAKWIAKTNTKDARRSAEAVEAVDATMEAITKYMSSRAEEDAEIAANNYLDGWRLVFDTKGEKAARAAADAVIGNTTDEGMKTRLLAMRDSLDEYIKAGGAAGAGDRGTGGETAAEKARRELISDLKAEATYLRKLADAHKELEQYMDEGVGAKMAEIFGDGDYSKESIETQIEDIIAALRNLGGEGADAADSIEQAWGMDRFSIVLKQLKSDKKAAEDAQKAMEKYQETLRKWMGEDFNLEGTGFEYDISKVFTDFNTKAAAVQEKYLAALKLAQEAHKGNAEAIAEETKKLEALRDAELAYVRTQSQESLNKLAESYLKDQYFMRGVSFDHLGDMTIGQLRNLRRELGEISKDAATMGFEFSGLEQTLASWGLDMQSLTEEDLAALSDRLPEATIESIRFAKAIKDTGLSMETLQEKIQSAIEKGLKNLDEQEKKALSKFAKYAAKQVLELADAFSELGEATGNARLQSTADAMQEIGDMASNVAQGFQQGGLPGAALALMVTSVKGIINDIANDAREAAEATERMHDALREYNKELEKSAIASQSTVFGDNSLGKLREYVKILKGSRSLIDDLVGIGNSGVAALLEAAGFIGPDGQLILERISAALSSGEIDGELAKDLTAAMESYKNALEEIDSITESLFGDLAASAADKMVDQWWEAGRAALDYADILEDVAKSYAKLVVKDVLLGSVFDDQQEGLKDAFKSGDAEKAMAIVSQAMQSAQEMLPVVESALSAFEPYRSMSGDESGSVGSGIKSITEETANLLASYINAIRADVSYTRVMQEKGWGDIALIGASFPTLNDYMNQVAANTYDTARNTQSILSELQSVIGAPGTSGSVVRVEAY